MPETFPNQRMIQVHRETLEGDFLVLKTKIGRRQAVI